MIEEEQTIDVSNTKGQVFPVADVRSHCSHNL